MMGMGREPVVPAMAGCEIENARKLTAIVMAQRVAIRMVEFLSSKCPRRKQTLSVERMVGECAPPLTNVGGDR